MGGTDNVAHRPSRFGVTAEESATSRSRGSSAHRAGDEQSSYPDAFPLATRRSSSPDLYFSQ